VVEERWRAPRDDFATVLTHAEGDGQPISTHELLSYFILLIVAGNETTRNATSVGLLALMENRGELEKLRRHPELLPSAVEEIVRWVSPVIFRRLIPRLEEVDLAGPVERMRSSFVGGIKRMPLRCRIASR
jgi:cytochrome P450